MGGLMSQSAATKGRGPRGIVLYQFFGDQLDFPNSADWAVNSSAAIAKDSNNAGITVRKFDDTTQEGVGLAIKIPEGYTNIKVILVSRAETAAASNLNVVPRLYFREYPNDSAVESWDSGTDMTTISMGVSNEYWQYDEQLFSLSSLNLVAGRVAHIELTRNAPSGSDTLVGDWALMMVGLEFS